MMLLLSCRNCFEIYGSRVIMKTSLLHLRFAKTVILLGLLGTLFYSLLMLREEQQHKVNAEFQSSHSLCKVWVVDIPEVKPRSVKLHVRILNWIDAAQMSPANGQALVYLQKDSSSLQIALNDVLVIPCQWRRITNTKNPGCFQYKEYCERQAVYFTQWVKSTHWHIQGRKHGLLTCFIEASQYLRHILAAYIPNKNNVAFAEALLIGYRKALDADTYQDYANTGLSHVIAISGMHIGMVYFSLRTFLLWLPFFKKKASLKTLLALAGIWFFAAMTGLPPSVLRSTIMFTCLGIGEFGKRRITVYNNLCASACLLLFINPTWLFDPGFQLSYLAVFSLALLYRPIYTLWYTESFWLDKLWQLVAATLAAQVFTLPISLYYFHQFPLLFVLNNVYGVLLTTVILYAEILLILCSGCKVVAMFLGTCISKTIDALHAVVHWFAQLEQTRIQHVQFGILETILFYGLIVLVLLFLFYRKIVFVFGAGMSLMLLLLCGVKARWEHAQQQRMFCFNDTHYLSLGYISGTSYYVETNDTSKSNQRERFLWNPMKSLYDVTHKSNNLIRKIRWKQAELIEFEGRFLLVVKGPKVRFERKIRVDAVLLYAGRLPKNLEDSVESNHWVEVKKPNKQGLDQRKNAEKAFKTTKSGAWELNFTN